jgi:hypothetical protein
MYCSLSLVSYGFDSRGETLGEFLQISTDSVGIEDTIIISDEAFEAIKDKGTQQITVSYDVQKNTDSFKTGSVTFNIIAQEKCDANSLFDYKWNLLEDRVSSSSSGGSSGSGTENGNTQVN